MANAGHETDTLRNNMSFKLRPYQKELVTAVRESMTVGNKRVLMVGSTGLGKTAILFDMAQRTASRGGKVLLIVHRRNLVFQTAAKFKEYGMEAGIIMSGVEPDLDSPIQIASIWTYSRRLKLAKNNLNKFFINANLTLIDECHKSLSPTFKEVMGNYKDKFVVGVTATPCTSSGAAMGDMYDDLVDTIPIKRLIQGGHLVDCVYYGGKSPDMTGVSIVGGDYDKKELGKRSNTPELVGDIVENWFRLAHDRQTIIFAVNRKHARYICDSFMEKNISAAYLDARSSDEERADVLDQFGKDKIQIIVNVALFQEFLDLPNMSCVVIARKTKSLGLWRQMIGRGLRPYPGKNNCMVIDHGDGVRTLGLITDEIEWTLDGKKAYKAKKQDKKEKPHLECDQCRLLFKGRVCPECGFEIPNYGKKIETTKTELQLLKKTKKQEPTREEKERFYGQLEYERKIKSFNKGWAAHKYKEKFGVWPRNMSNIPDVPPDQNFNNWLTYQRIKWAKSKKRLGKQ